MQRLDAPVHDFGKARVLRHLGNRDALLCEQAGGATGREDGDAALLKRACEFHHASFVGYRNQCATQRHRHGLALRQAEFAQFAP